MIEYELSSKARLINFVNRMLARWPPKNWLETQAVEEFKKRILLLSEEECFKLLEEAHQA